MDGGKITLERGHEDEWFGKIYQCPFCADIVIWPGFKFCPSCGKPLQDVEFAAEFVEVR